MVVNGSHHYLALVVQLLRFGDPQGFLLPISHQELFLHALNNVVGRLSLLLGRVRRRFVLLDALLDLLADFYLLEGKGEAQLRVDGFACFGLRPAEQLFVDGGVEFGFAFELAVRLWVEELACCVAEDDVGSGAIWLLVLQLLPCRQRGPVLFLQLVRVDAVSLLAYVGYPGIVDKWVQVVLLFEFLMAVTRQSEVLLNVCVDLLIIAGSYQVEQSASGLLEHYLKGFNVLLLQQQVVPE